MTIRDILLSSIALALIYHQQVINTRSTASKYAFKLLKKKQAMYVSIGESSVWYIKKD